VFICLSYFVMKKLWFYILDKLRDFIYKHRNLYERKPVYEKDLKNKSLDELILLKESERDYLSLNIPIVLGILWTMTVLDDFWWKSWFIFLLIIVWVNVAVALQEKKENTKIYNKIINQKLKEKREDDKKYQKEILKYLKNIEKRLNDNGK